MSIAIPGSIQPLLDAYLHALEPLQTRFSGIYIHGSIALDAFEERESDIDIVALTQGEWTVHEQRQLAALHAQLSKQHRLSQLFEIVYLPLHDLGKQNSDIAPHPAVQNGKFYPVGHGGLNAVTWWIMKNKGICLYGLERSQLPLEVSWKDVLATMQYNLNDYWKGKAQKRPYLFLSDYWIVFSVSTLCRILTTLEEGEIIAKSPALVRWRDSLPARWQPLVDEAWRIRRHLKQPPFYRNRVQRMRETLAFIAYMRERGNKALEATM